ncbi:hypothetical protein OUZ56_029583 [Daphnia magna]|uniref:Uncharacterized protein n=1 Tax=Daphnia magna TaxID=35525 RepID=A0ABR0B790_9CRUS|nr:hypothetical protein OUZ56_029583 [Daphnia magna]
MAVLGSWYEFYIGAIQRTLQGISNTSPQPKTPYYLNHGRDAVMPIDRWLQTTPSDPITPQDYKSGTMKRLFKAFYLVKENLEKARAQQKEQYNKRLIWKNDPCTDFENLRLNPARQVIEEEEEEELTTVEDDIVETPDSREAFSLDLPIDENKMNISNSFFGFTSPDRGDDEVAQPARPERRTGLRPWSSRRKPKIALQTLVLAAFCGMRLAFNATTCNCDKAIHKRFLQFNDEGCKPKITSAATVKCKIHETAHKNAITMAQYNGLLAASNLNLPNCTKLQPTGTDVAVLQCTPQVVTFSTAITDCGLQPKVGNSTISVEGWKLTAHRDSDFVNFNGRTHSYKNGTWEPIVPFVAIKGTKLINALSFEVDNTLALFKPRPVVGKLSLNQPEAARGTMANAYETCPVCSNNHMIPARGANPPYPVINPRRKFHIIGLPSAGALIKSFGTARAPPSSASGFTKRHFIAGDDDYRVQEYVPTRYHVNTDYAKENAYEDRLPRYSTPSPEGYDHADPLEESIWEPPSSPIQAQEDAPAHNEI